MNAALRQFGMAIAVSVVSLGLVVGGLSLALSENFTPPPMATVTFGQPTAPAPLTATTTPQILPTSTLLPTATNTALPPLACTPPMGWVGIVVGPADTLDSLAVRYKSSAQALAEGNCLLTQSLVAGSVLFVPSIPSNTAIPCGSPLGWVRYTVQPGDTLYHIATSFGTTTARLQQANCMGFSTTIRVGQLLWVPNVPTRTPGETLVPTFDSSTAIPTEPPTEPATEPPTETIAPTGTPEPSNTPNPSPTLTPPTTLP